MSLSGSRNLRILFLERDKASECFRPDCAGLAVEMLLEGGESA